MKLQKEINIENQRLSKILKDKKSVLDLRNPAHNMARGHDRYERRGSPTFLNSSNYLAQSTAIANNKHISSIRLGLGNGSFHDMWFDSSPKKLNLPKIPSEQESKQVENLIDKPTFFDANRMVTMSPDMLDVPDY